MNLSIPQRSLLFLLASNLHSAASELNLKVNSALSLHADYASRLRDFIEDIKKTGKLIIASSSILDIDSTSFEALDLNSRVMKLHRSIQNLNLDP